ncbi:unnamed protein product, partial [Protopolystoma xenopodis]
MPAKRLEMYQVHGSTLDLIMHTIDFGLELDYISLYFLPEVNAENSHGLFCASTCDERDGNSDEVVDDSGCGVSDLAASDDEDIETFARLKQRAGRSLLPSSSPDHSLLPTFQNGYSSTSLPSSHTTAFRSHGRPSPRNIQSSRTRTRLRTKFTQADFDRIGRKACLELGSVTEQDEISNGTGVKLDEEGEEGNYDDQEIDDAYSTVLRLNDSNLKRLRSEEIDDEDDEDFSLSGFGEHALAILNSSIPSGEANLDVRTSSTPGSAVMASELYMS